MIDALGVSLYDNALALVLLDPKYLEERTEQGKDSFGFTPSEGPIHGCLVSCTGTKYHGSGCVWWEEVSTAWLKGSRT